MARTIQLLSSSSVTLDGSGNGTCPPLIPQSPGETWVVTCISVQCATNTLESIASAYLNGHLLGTTTWGSTGDSDTGIAQPVANGQQLTATWTGGDAGTKATMTVIGTKTVA